MFELDNNKSNNTSSTTVSKSDKVQAKVWLNVGTTINIDGEDHFVSLPFGLAMDTMQPAKVPNGDSKYALQQRLKNDLLKQLVEKGMSLNLGDSTKVNGLTLELRRVNDEVAPSTSISSVDLGLSFS